jgi:catechol 2,3-dioxygenase-like lactoylglutathione lyase family enzyme
MIEGISAVTLGTHEMPRAVRFYRTLGFEFLHGGEDPSFTSFRAGASYLNLITQPTERRWSWWGRVVVVSALSTFPSLCLAQLAPDKPNYHDGAVSDPESVPGVRQADEARRRRERP